MPKLILDIETCGECPYCIRVPDKPVDPWDRLMPTVWTCTKSGGRKIQGYIEWFDPLLVPDWCPLRPQDALAVLMKLQGNSNEI